MQLLNKIQIWHFFNYIEISNIFMELLIKYFNDSALIAVVQNKNTEILRLLFAQEGIDINIKSI